MKSLPKTIVEVLFALAMFVLAAGGILDRGMSRIGLGDLALANQRYLDESYDSALDGFLVLSAVKSGLAVIEGSEVGIGFSLQLGDLVQSVYDYVDIAWKTVLAGGTIILMTRLALEGIALVGHYVLAMAFCAWMIMAAVKGFCPQQHGLGRLVQSITAASLFVAVLFYLALPLAVFGASRLSVRITRPMIHASYDTFSEVSRTFAGDGLTAGSDLSDDGSPAEQTRMGLKQRYEHLKARLGELETYLGEQAKRLAGTTFHLIAAYLFDCVIFPLAFVAVLALLVRELPGYLVGAARDRRLAETIRRAIPRSNPPF